MAFTAVGAALGIRKMGGLIQIYRTTTASAKSVASKFRRVVADKFSAAARRNASEDEVDMEYHAMEDAEPLGPWIQDTVNDARRERNMTRKLHRQQ